MTRITMNQMGVIDNRHQRYDEFKRVVTVCSAGCLRSPTAAVVLAADPFNHNTRAAGLTDSYAIISLDPRLMAWADEFVVMERHMLHAVGERYKEFFDRDIRAQITVLDIPDNYAYRDPELVQLIATRYTEAHNASQ
jgi:predicted protein tyrosine phosphatase